MADRRAQLTLAVKAEGARQAAIDVDSISTVAAKLKGELTALERGDVLKELGTTAAFAAANTGELDRAMASLAAELKTIGASEKEIRKINQEFERTTATIEKARAAQEKLGAAMAKDAEKARAAQEKLGAKMSEDIEAELRAQTRLNEQRRLAATGATTLQKELSQISRADQLQKLAVEMGTLARKTGDVGGAVSQLDKKLKALGANKDEIAGLAGTFNAATGSTSLSGRLSYIGNQARALPSQRISLPGGGDIGTDAIANFVRLGGAITGVSEKVAQTSKVAQFLTPALGEAAAGFIGMGAALLPYAIVFGAAALAVKSLSDEVSKSADVINATVDAQREANKEIVDGLTSDEVRKNQEDLNKARKLEQAILDQTTAAYADFEQQTQAAVDSGKNLAESLAETVFGQGFVVAGAKLVRADEEALNQQRETSIANLAEIDAKTADYNILLESGALAANDAAEAEKKLAEERSKAALASADTAAKELQAQQKALNATEDQNKKRLETIEEEKAVVQKQIDTLTESGVTSEEVTAKLAALNGQLGSLGKESEFIKNTALEASRQADAEKKAKKDAEDAAKKAEQAQEQYTKAVDSATRTYKQSVEDIGTRLRQTLADNTLKLNRDLTDIATKYRRDEYDLTIKANRAERDALQDQLDDLDDMRRDALKDEQQAIQEGDFKALFLARQKGAETVQQEAAEIERDRQKRQQNAEDARADLLRAAERQRSDRVMGYDRQNMDARTAQQRELQQAVTTRQRALQVATEGLNAELKQLGNYYAARLKMDQQYQNNSLKIASGGGSQGANANSPFGAMQSTFRAMGGVIRK